MFTLAVPTATEIHTGATRATRNGFRLESARAYAIVTGGHRPYVVSWAGCTCSSGTAGLWCDHRSLYAVALGQVPQPSRPPAPIIPFTPRKTRQEWRPRPLRKPAPVIPFKRPAA